MKEFIEKLIGRIMLESASCKVYKLINPNKEDIAEFNAYKKCIEIVKELAEEHKGGWIPCSERLPEDGQQVLVFYDNCLYSCMSVAKFRKGKTKEELQSMEWPCFGSADQWGNNLKPYAWFGDGPMEWFGQEIIAWQPLPEPYRAPTEEKIKKT